MSFERGVSGNPNGRPKGSGNRVQEMREGLWHRIPAVVERLFEQAIDGDAAASKLLLERVFPALRLGEVNVQLPLPKGRKNINDAAIAVLDEMAEGRISPDSAKTLSEVLATLQRIRESLDLVLRIERLENQHQGPLPPLTYPEQRVPPNWVEVPGAEYRRRRDEEDPE